jgi:hypothetical protein
MRRSRRGTSAAAMSSLLSGRERGHSRRSRPAMCSAIRLRGRRAVRSGNWIPPRTTDSSSWLRVSCAGVGHRKSLRARTRSRESARLRPRGHDHPNSPPSGGRADGAPHAYLQLLAGDAPDGHSSSCAPAFGDQRLANSFHRIGARDALAWETLRREPAPTSTSDARRARHVTGHRVDEAHAHLSAAGRESGERACAG